MIPIDILDKIASWTGWSPISLFLVLVIGLLVYFSKEKISTIKLKVEAVESQKDILKEQIDILKNNSPDVLAKRYREEIDLLQDGIMLLSKNKVDIEFKPPFRLMVKYPGMHKTILWIQDNESKQIGGIPNRFYTFYDRD